MKKLLFMLMVLAFALPTFGALGTFPINYQNCSNPELLRRMLTDRIGGLERTVNENPATGNRGTGVVYYVDSGVGSDSYDGTSWTKAKATLDAAVGLCTADRGDVIYIAQGHAENLSGADGVDIDVAGVTVVGIGNGDLRPTFTYTNAAGEIVIGADDVFISNIICNASVTTTLKAIDVEAGAENATIVGCRFGVDAAGTDEFNNSIVIGDASDKPVIVGNEFRQGAAAAVSAILLDHDADEAIILGNKVFGDYSTACIVSDTAASLEILIADNILVNGTNGGTAGLNTEPCIELLATTSGVIVNNQIACNVATPDAAIVAADCWLYNNIYTETEGGVSVPPNWVTTDTVANILGYDDNDNSYSSSNVAANADGSIIERLEQIDVDTSAIIADTAAIQPYQELAISKASISLVSGSVDDVFAIAGGPVLVTSLSVVFTEAASNNSVTLAFTADPTSGAGDLAIASAVDVDNTAVGGWVYAEGDGSAAVISAIGGNIAQGCTYPFVLPVGGLDIDMGSSNLTTGIVTAYMTYKPMTTTSAVTAP